MLIALVSLLLLSFMISTQTVKADVYTSNYIAYGSGVCLYSPLNQTYTTGSLLLNLTFGKGIGLDCQLSYSIDGQSYHEIPMTAPTSNEYHTVVQMMVPPVQLPTLNDGSHCLTINVNASAEGYTHSWVHTVYFTVDTGKATSTPTSQAVTSPTPTPTEITAGNPSQTAVSTTPEPPSSAPVVAIIVLVAIAIYVAVIVVLATRKGNP